MPLRYISDMLNKLWDQMMPSFIMFCRYCEKSSLRSFPAEGLKDMDLPSPLKMDLGDERQDENQSRPIKVYCKRCQGIYSNGSLTLWKIFPLLPERTRPFAATEDSLAFCDLVNI